jgi:Flp pilus assembly protein TadG
MLTRNRLRSRRAGVTVEFAVVASSLLFLVFGLIVGGMGIFRYQEVAHLAREGARYASTHGGQYSLEGIPQQTGVSAISSSSDLSSYLASKTVSVDSNYLNVAVSWTAPSSVSPSNMPTYMNTDSSLVPPGQSVTQNYVIVTVTYKWLPELYLVGPITLSSTSEMAMSY